MLRYVCSSSKIRYSAEIFHVLGLDSNIIPKDTDVWLVYNGPSNYLSYIIGDAPFPALQCQLMSPIEFLLICLKSSQK